MHRLTIEGFKKKLKTEIVKNCNTKILSLCDLDLQVIYGVGDHTT